MNTNKLQRSIRIAGMVFTMVFGFIFLSATTASAQNRDDRRNDNQNNRQDDRNRNDRNDRNDDDDDDDDYDNRDDDDRDYNNQNNRNNSIVQQAYRAGMRQGTEDARNGYRANAQRAAGQAMRGMNNGNNSRWGNQRNFRQTYREAFIRGYQEAYDRYDNRNNRRKNKKNRNNNGRNGY